MEEKSLSNFMPIKVFLKNLILEFILSIIMLFILSVLLSKTSLSEEIITPAIIFISSFCILLGGFMSSRKIDFKGIVIGILQGVLYMTILYIFSSILSQNFVLGKESIMMLLIGILCGAVRWNYWS